MIPWFVEGTMNVLKHHGIIVGPMGRTGRDTNIFIANSGHAVLATDGGFVEILVKLNEKVEVGQKVAIQRNTFGEVVADYSSAGPERSAAIARRDSRAKDAPGIRLLQCVAPGKPS
jgi:predicted deacylase